MVSGELGVSGSSSLCSTFEGFDELLWGGVVALGGSVFAVKLGVSVGLGLCSLCMAPISSSFGYLARIRSSFSLSRLADFCQVGSVTDLASSHLAGFTKGPEGRTGRVQGKGAP